MNKDILLIILYVSSIVGCTISFILASVYRWNNPTDPNNPFVLWIVLTAVSFFIIEIFKGDKEE